MSEFDKQRKAFRQARYQPYAEASHLTNAGLLVLAEGLAEVIELLRPLVERQSEKPRGDGSACAHLIPGGHGSDRCVLPHGHDGLHRLADGQSWGNSTTEVEAEHDQRCGHFGPVTDRGAFGVRRPVCNRNSGHPGPHGTGIVGETWLR